MYCSSNPKELQGRSTSSRNEHAILVESIVTFREERKDRDVPGLLLVVAFHRQRLRAKIARECQKRGLKRTDVFVHKLLVLVLVLVQVLTKINIFSEFG